MADHWQHFAHGADIGVRGIGATKARAFEQAALALTAVVTDLAGVRSVQCVELSLRASEDALLLYEWLNAIVFEMATRGMLFGAAAVVIKEGTLTAELWGEPVDRTRHEPAVEIKGATLTALEVGRREDGAWLAQCVVDV